MLTFCLVMPQANGASPNSALPDIRTAQASAMPRHAITQLSPKADKAARVERALVRDARKDKWWMAFVGITIVGYRLLRKHQSLFGNSLLYASYGNLEQRTVASIDSLNSELQPVEERLARAS